MKGRKKPVIVDYIQWTGINANEIFSFVGEKLKYYVDEDMSTAYIAGQGSPICVIEIPTLEGVMKALSGDYIIKGVQGEFYPCKPDIFAQTYEIVDDIHPCEACNPETNPTCTEECREVCPLTKGSG